MEARRGWRPLTRDAYIANPSSAVEPARRVPISVEASKLTQMRNNFLSFCHANKLRVETRGSLGQTNVHAKAEILRSNMKDISMNDAGETSSEGDSN